MEIPVIQITGDTTGDHGKIMVIYAQNQETHEMKPERNLVPFRWDCSMRSYMG